MAGFGSALGGVPMTCIAIARRRDRNIGNMDDRGQMGECVHLCRERNR